MKKSFIKLEKAAREMHLRVIEGEIQNTRSGKWDRGYSTTYIKIGSYTFERIYSLIIWAGC
jgi:hypothetical protein